MWQQIKEPCLCHCHLQQIYFLLLVNVVTVAAIQALHLAGIS